MERLTKRLDNGKELCIDVCGEKCVDGYTWCPKCKPFTDVMKKLADYEDVEEQGLLLRLPCNVGDTVWCIEEFEDGFEYSGYKFMAMCGEFVIVTPKYSNCDFKEQLHEMERESREWEGISVDMFKKENVFITKEEAEQALARTEKENG